MKNLAIARRYAKALLAIGKDDGNAETYRSELSGVTRIFCDDQQLETVINNPLYPSVSRKQILQSILQKIEISAVMKSYLLLLFDKGRFGFLKIICEFYEKLADDYKGIARAKLTSAIELSTETIEKIRSAISRKTGREIVLEVEHDPMLIGGIVTKIGDLVLDGSIRTQLLNMKESLKRGERV